MKLTRIVIIAAAAVLCAGAVAPGGPGAARSGDAGAQRVRVLFAAPQAGSIVVGNVNKPCTGSIDTVRVDVRLQDTPLPLDAAGLDIAYDPAHLAWAGHERGELTAGWQFFDSADLGAVIRVGGFDAAALPAGTSGVFVTLRFLVSCCGAVPLNNPLCPLTAVDDIETMTKLCGDVVCVPVATRASTWGGVKALFR